ncbi:hypothetical protein CGLAMM_08160 [Acetobacteraceae bacterium EV16G]|uniref:Uncharacterized protein n=2 Tax=Sorlinia euscelidii TaxID=3081148 RepID=A0ABU7U583_9PROT
MRFVPLALTALAIMLAAPSARADDPIECSDQERSLPAGSYTGIIESIMVKQSWSQDYVHFRFRNESDHKLYCIRQTTSGNANIVALAKKAFLLDQKVSIDTADGYWVTAVNF